MTKGSIGPAFAVVPDTEGHDQASFCPFTLREVSVLTELALGHLRYLLIDVPPQSDRKSTRLNSSHLVISYAVFCLKKKKHTASDNILLDRSPIRCYWSSPATTTSSSTSHASSVLSRARLSSMIPATMHTYPTSLIN